MTTMAIWLKAMYWRSRDSSTSSGLPRAGRCFHLEKTSGTPCLYTSSPICVNSPTTTSSITPHESGSTTAWPTRARMSGSILSCRTSIAAAEKLSIMAGSNERKRFASRARDRPRLVGSAGGIGRDSHRPAYNMRTCKGHRQGHPGRCGSCVAFAPKGGGSRDAAAPPSRAPS